MREAVIVKLQDARLQCAVCAEGILGLHRVEFVLWRGTGMKHDEGMPVVSTDAMFIADKRSTVNSQRTMLTMGTMSSGCA